jgi:hypothetical protein
MHQMRYWLDYDPVALAVLVIGIGMIELLAWGIWWVLLVEVYDRLPPIMKWSPAATQTKLLRIPPLGAIGGTFSTSS